MKGHEVLQRQLLLLRMFLGEGRINERQIPIIKSLLDKIPFITSLTTYSRIETLTRVTVNKNLFNGEQRRIEEQKFLKYPPSEYVKKYGRMNQNNQSILYATFDHITALSELRPQSGDLITISKWRLHTDKELLLSPVFRITTTDGEIHNEMALRYSMEYKKLLKQYDEESATQFDMLLGFIAECFAKKVNPSNHWDYFMSAYFANKIFYEFEKGTVKAILYPSVRQSLTLNNIAMKPEVFDSNYMLTEVQESIVSQIPTQEHPGWNLLGTGWTKKIKDGIITW